MSASVILEMFDRQFSNGPSTQLVGLVYELLDAHEDTAQLLRDGGDELEWAAHLDYLQRLQRVARGRLAQATSVAASAA